MYFYFKSTSIPCTARETRLAVSISPCLLAVKLITRDDAEPDKVAQAIDILGEVQKLIAEGHTDMSLDDLLATAEVTENEYASALEVSCTGSVVLLQREPKECCINNYNPSVMLARQANLDIQFVLNAYACVMYVASYIMKTERSMGELLKRVCIEYCSMADPDRFPRFPLKPSFVCLLKIHYLKLAPRAQAA